MSERRKPNIARLIGAPAIDGVEVPFDYTPPTVEDQLRSDLEYAERQIKSLKAEAQLRREEIRAKVEFEMETLENSLRFRAAKTASAACDTVGQFFIRLAIRCLEWRARGFEKIAVQDPDLYNELRKDPIV